MCSDFTIREMVHKAEKLKIDISIKRDELRSLYEEIKDLIVSLDEGIEELTEGIYYLDIGIDKISEQF